MLHPAARMQCIAWLQQDAQLMAGGAQSEISLALTTTWRHLKTRDHFCGHPTQGLLTYRMFLLMGRPDLLAARLDETEKLFYNIANKPKNRYLWEQWPGYYDEQLDPQKKFCFTNYLMFANGLLQRGKLKGCVAALSYVQGVCATHAT